MEIKNKKLTLAVTLLFVGFFLLPGISIAQNSPSYQVLAPLPGFETSYGKGNFGQYVERMIYLAITLAALLAVANLVWGGTRYMGGETLHTKSAGVAQMQRSVVGLLILCASFLILNTINPYILNFQLHIDDVTPGAGARQNPTNYQQADLTSVSNQKRSEFEANPSAPIEIPYRTGTAEELQNMQAVCQQASKGTKNNPIRIPEKKVYLCT